MNVVVDNDTDKCDFADEVAPCSKDNSDGDLTDEELLYMRKGHFFALAFIPMAIFGVITGMNHLLTFAFNGGFYRVAAAIALDLVHPMENESTQTSSLLYWHALLGISVTMLVAAQVLTGNLAHHSVLISYRRVHKMLGRVVVPVWILVVILGATFSLLSKRKHIEYGSVWDLNRIGAEFLGFGSIAIGTVVNMLCGFRAINSCSGDNSRAMYLFHHKGLMFFACFWILGAAFDECLMSVVQVCFSECFIDTFGIIVCAAAGQTFQMVALIAGSYLYEKAVLHHTFVRVNFVLLGTRTVLYVIGAFLMGFSDKKAYSIEETSCYAD